MKTERIDPKVIDWIDRIANHLAFLSDNSSVALDRLVNISKLLFDGDTSAIRELVDFGDSTPNFVHDATEIKRMVDGLNRTLNQWKRDYPNGPFGGISKENREEAMGEVEKLIRRAIMKKRLRKVWGEADDQSAAADNFSELVGDLAEAMDKISGIVAQEDIEILWGDIKSAISDEGYELADLISLDGDYSNEFFNFMESLAFGGFSGDDVRGELGRVADSVKDWEFELGDKSNG